MLKEIERSKGKKILIIGPPGVGKTIVAHEIASHQQHVLLGCKSNDQLRHHYTNTAARCRKNRKPIYAEAIYSKGHLVEHHFGMKAVFQNNLNIWEPDKLDNEATKNLILSKSPVSKMSKIQQTVFSDFFESDETYSNQIDPQIFLHFMTHARLKSLAINQLYQDELIVIFDDICSQDLNPLYSTKNNGNLNRIKIDGEKLSTVQMGDDAYYLRPDKYEPLNNWKEGTTVIATTTEESIKMLFEAKYPDGVVINLYADSNDSIKSNITYVSTDKTTRNYDGFLPMLSQSVMEGWNHEFIGDGMGLQNTFAKIKGVNNKRHVNLLIECSYPAQVRTNELFDGLCYLSSAIDNQYDRDSIATTLMKDELEQALGRNQGHRFEGFEAIVLLNKNHRKGILAKCQFNGEVIDCLSKYETDHPMLIALKGFNAFVMTGEYKKWISPAINNANDPKKMKLRLDGAADNWKRVNARRYNKQLLTKKSKFKTAKKMYLDEGFSRKVIRERLNLKNWYSNDEMKEMFDEFDCSLASGSGFNESTKEPDVVSPQNFDT